MQTCYFLYLLFFYLFFFFFFSSRRRHTRWNCDWSSDVCSSDLDQEVLALRLLRRDDVRAELRGQLDLVLVDEFQDTSPIQLAVFLELGNLEIGRASCRERV